MTTAEKRSMMDIVSNRRTHRNEGFQNQQLHAPHFPHGFRFACRYSDQLNDEIHEEFPAKKDTRKCRPRIIQLEVFVNLTSIASATLKASSRRARRKVADSPRSKSWPFGSIKLLLGCFKTPKLPPATIYASPTVSSFQSPRASTRVSKALEAKAIK